MNYENYSRTTAMKIALRHRLEARPLLCKTTSQIFIIPDGEM